MLPPRNALAKQLRPRGNRGGGDIVPSNWTNFPNGDIDGGSVVQLGTHLRAKRKREELSSIIRLAKK